MTLIIGGVVSSGLLNQPQPRLDRGQAKQITKESFPQKSIVSTNRLKVDVSGAVKEPGVFDLEDDSRVEDAVVKAGGFLETANTIYVSKYLNLSKKVSDGEKIYIPFDDEPVESLKISSSNLVNSPGKINLNGSTQAEVESLPGVGMVTATKIISARPFESVEELMTKKIVGKAVYDKVKDLVEVN